jgi:hypothetical protein
MLHFAEGVGMVTGENPMTTVAGTSPRLKARMAGVFWMIATVGNLFNYMYVSQRIYVFDNAATTSHNILALERLYRAGLVADLTGRATFVVVTALLYQLFKPVNRSVSLVTTFFGLAGCAIGAVNFVFMLAPLAILRGAPYSMVFGQGQLNALALLSRNLAGVGGNITMIFFGAYCLLVGLLVVKSTFVPRLLGLLMVIAGLTYLANSAVSLLGIRLPQGLSGYFLWSGIGELLFALWLLIIGVNSDNWYREAKAAHQNANG